MFGLLVGLPMNGKLQTKVRSCLNKRLSFVLNALDLFRLSQYCNICNLSFWAKRPHIICLTIHQLLC